MVLMKWDSSISVSINEIDAEASETCGYDKSAA